MYLIYNTINENDISMYEKIYFFKPVESLRLYYLKKTDKYPILIHI